VPQKKKEFNSFLNAKNLEIDDRIPSDTNVFFNDYHNNIYQNASKKVKILRVT